MQSEINTITNYMKAYFYSQHIIALIQNMGVQNVILSQGFFTLFSVLFLSFIHGFLPARGRKTDYIINMALQKYMTVNQRFQCSLLLYNADIKNFCVMPGNCQIVKKYIRL